MQKESGHRLLLMQNRQLDIQMISTYILSLLLIGIGANIIRKYFRKKEPCSLKKP